MKHMIQIPAGKNTADVDASSDQTEYEPELVADVDSIIDEIQTRANYVGPVLEEILHASHDSVSWDS